LNIGTGDLLAASFLNNLSPFEKDGAVVKPLDISARLPLPIPNLKAATKE
jgi:hypothetical protein